MQSELAKQVAELPNKPGVYRYFDGNNKLLYVGKAASLKRRVSSYFQRPQDFRISELVRKINHLEYSVTDSVVEALFLEAYQIQTLQPPYNIRQKDDKSFVTIGITKELFPRVLVVRPTQKLTVDLLYQFGPYTSADLARKALLIVRRILPFRTICQVSGKFPGRGCLDYQLGLCPGPCAGLISEKEYTLLIRKLVLFLEGKKNILIRTLTREMTQAAKKADFELAANIRDQLTALQHIQDVALIKRSDIEEQQLKQQEGLPKRIEGYDISNIGESYAVGSMVVVENGAVNKAEYRKFQIKTVVGQNDLRMMEEVLTRRMRHLEWPLPDLFVIDGGPNHLRVALRVLKKFKSSIPVIAVAKGPERKKLDLYPSKQTILNQQESLLPMVRLARDEAHRFAISYHRNRRDRQFLVD